MSVFKKTCFECGAKEDRLFEGKCMSCFNQEIPPIEEIKQIKLRTCNMCKKIHYKHGLFTLKKIEEMIPVIVEKNLVLNKNYELKSLKIENFGLIKGRVCFDVKVDCNLLKK